MSQISSAVAHPIVEPEDRLELLLRQQRVLAWLFSIVTLALTVTFFAMMTLAAPLLSRVVFGRSVTLATVAAVGIIVWYLISIALFGLHCDRVDQARQTRGER